MASFEAGRYCTAQEYHKYIDNRHTPEQITLGEDFTFMALLHRSKVTEGEAIALPVRCQSYPKAYRNHGIWIIKFAALDEDCQPLPEPETIYLADDGMIAITEEFRRIDPWITEGYIRDYDDGFGDDLHRLLESKDLALI